MEKEEFMKLIICEYWFSLKHWKGKNWGEKEKKIWISGMHRTWNILHPDNPIEPLELHRLREQWDKNEAEEWYNDWNAKLQEDYYGDIPFNKRRWYLMDFEGWEKGTTQ